MHVSMLLQGRRYQAFTSYRSIASIQFLAISLDVVRSATTYINHTMCGDEPALSKRSLHPLLQHSNRVFRKPTWINMKETKSQALFCRQASPLIPRLLPEYIDWSSSGRPSWQPRQASNNAFLRSARSSSSSLSCPGSVQNRTEVQQVGDRNAQKTAGNSAVIADSRSPSGTPARVL